MFCMQNRYVVISPTTSPIFAEENAAAGSALRQVRLPEADGWCEMLCCYFSLLRAYRLTNSE